MQRVIVLVAGEASGDQLGAALIRSLQVQHPAIRFSGIGGPLMKATGMDCWWDSDQLAVMGLFEVIAHVPRLLKLRKQLIERIVALNPTAYIGIDAPDFNLGVEKRLKSRGLPVVHYVSPTVWAWRPGRVKTIAEAADLVLCLFPFEPDYYAQHDVKTAYTGHPLADEIALQNDASAARIKLDVRPTDSCIALLPGSRIAEVEKLCTPMLDAAAELAGHRPELVFLMPAATDRIREYLEAELQQHPALNCHIYSGRAKQVMAAADVVVCASGTATLEVMLVNRPMVVCYKLSPMTHRLVTWFKLVKSRFFALPNILASEALVPELLQQDVNGPRIALEVSNWLDEDTRCKELQQRFNQLHQQLQTDAAATAASAVLNQLGLTAKPSGNAP